MDGIVRVRTIAFTPDRMPTLRRIKLGFEGDNLVERLEFDLPDIAQGQTATLMITGADAVKLDRTDEGRYAVDLTREMIGPDGKREAYVRIDGTGEKVWKSAPMRMITGALPDVEEEIEKVYPTAVGQMLTAMAEHSGEMQAQEERVEQAAQRAEEAAKRAEAGGGGGGGGGGSTVEIDTTLTQEGKAADAKATGDRISQLSKEIDNLNVGGVTTLTDAQVASCKAFAKRVMNAKGRVDSFLFFTDPHLAGDTDVSYKFERELNQIEAVYNNTPTSACVCGGDWLNSNNTKDNASWVLGKIDGAMKRRFKDYILIVGNHDTNYQGYDYFQSGADGTYDRDECEKCILPNETIRNLWHRGRENLYFDTEIDSGKYYVFDTGIDWYPDMDDYKWGQVDWFANDLISTKPERCAALLHIAGYSASNPTPFVENITLVAQAYNNKSSVTLNGKTYDFTAATGKFYFILGGHKHDDVVYLLNGIAVVMTTNLQVDTSKVSFDLVLVDYATDKIHMVRVGKGDNRTISLINGSVSDGENLFDIGTSVDDYFYFDETSKINGLTVDAANGSLTAPSWSGAGQFIFRNTMFENDGSVFRLRATVSNEVNLPATYAYGIKAYNANGERVTVWDADHAYSDYWKAFRITRESVAVDSTEYCDDTFILPDTVATFQIGFNFVTPRNGEAMTPVTFKDIVLTKS